MKFRLCDHGDRAEYFSAETAKEFRVALTRAERTWAKKHPLVTPFLQVQAVGAPDLEKIFERPTARAAGHPGIWFSVSPRIDGRPQTSRARYVRTDTFATPELAEELWQDAIASEENGRTQMRGIAALPSSIFPSIFPDAPR